MQTVKFNNRIPSELQMYMVEYILEIEFIKHDHDPYDLSKFCHNGYDNELFFKGKSKKWLCDADGRTIYAKDKKNNWYELGYNNQTSAEPIKPYLPDNGIIIVLSREDLPTK